MLASGENPLDATQKASSESYVVYRILKSESHAPVKPVKRLTFEWKRFICKKLVGICCGENPRTRESSFWMFTFCGCFYSLILNNHEIRTFNRQSQKNLIDFETS